MLINLINNARDAILETGGKDKWIKVNYFDNGDYIKLIVSDSGPGVPKECREKIMESFFTTKKIGKGNGLGLSLAKRFITEHNGQIYLDSDSEHTAFVIEIPRNQSNEDAA